MDCRSKRCTCAGGRVRRAERRAGSAPTSRWEGGGGREMRPWCAERGGARWGLRRKRVRCSRRVAPEESHGGRGRLLCQSRLGVHSPLVSHVLLVRYGWMGDLVRRPRQRTRPSARGRGRRGLCHGVG